MRSIFLTKDGLKIREVYSGNVRERLKKLSIDVDAEYSERDIGLKDFSDVDCIFSTWNMPVLTEAQIKQYFPNLRAVFYAAGTVKYFAEPYINCGIRIFNADQANGKAVADFVSGQILLAAKGYYQAQYAYKHRKYNMARKIVNNHSGNYDLTVGIIGAGRIGRAVIANLSGFDMRFLVCSPSMSSETARELGCEKADLADIFQKCDVISNHLPDIPSTAGILNYDLFRQMRDHSTFINTGRGRQVVEKDLTRILRENKSICAVLDVTSREPLLPISPLFFLDNAFLTPHIAGSTGNEEQRMAEYVVDAYEAMLAGQAVPYEVTIEKMNRTT